MGISQVRVGVLLESCRVFCNVVPPLCDNKSSQTNFLNVPLPTREIHSLTPKTSYVPEKSANLEWLNVLDLGVGVGPLSDF